MKTRKQLLKRLEKIHKQKYLLDQEHKEIISYLNELSGITKKIGEALLRRLIDETYEALVEGECDYDEMAKETYKFWSYEDTYNQIKYLDEEDSDEDVRKVEA